MDFQIGLPSSLTRRRHWRRSGHSHGTRWRESRGQLLKAMGRECGGRACKEAGGQAIDVVRCFRRCRPPYTGQATVDKWGRLDILVNNAGTTKLWTMPILTWIKPTLKFMPSTPLHPDGARGPHLKNCGAGSVVNISSVAGVRGVGSSVAYVASKGALNSMTLALPVHWVRTIFASMRYARALSARTGSAMRWARKCLTASSKDKNSTPCTAPERRTTCGRFCCQTRASKHVMGNCLWSMPECFWACR